MSIMPPKPSESFEVYAAKICSGVAARSRRATSAGGSDFSWASALSRSNPAKRIRAVASADEFGLPGCSASVGFSASARLCEPKPPLCEIARWNSPSARFETSRLNTSVPPADSPKIVTFFGSPPKAAAFSRTHSSERIRSSVPQLPDASSPFALLDQRRLAEPAERTEPVVGGDDHDAVASRELAAVVAAGVTDAVPAAVEPDHDGELALRDFARRAARRVHVQVQAVLVADHRAGLRIGRVTEYARELGTRRAELQRVAHAGPLGRRLRRAPAQLARRRRRERDAEPGLRLAVLLGEADELAGRDLALRGRVRDVWLRRGGAAARAA